ncbi:hypothetical protein C8N38_12035 [Rhodovulum kholense]|uniref:Uncharacterized protein n=2 Tax=Rhodovulum kholense TaxID=453584 RepID=A0A8E2VH45_9RHOB|nr:hypothetical protein C8N38_12035 [Rhodovulum kholense]
MTMKRSMTAILAGQEIELAATFRAAGEIGQKIADPLLIAREMAVTAMLESQGVEREPKFRFTVANIAPILLIGARAAGDRRDQAAMEEIVFDAGFFAAAAVARDYINLLCIPQTEESAAEEDAPSGE